MLNIGSQEILIILLLVFLLFGPRHIPQVASSLGKGLGEIRRTLLGIEESVRRSVSELPDPDLDRHKPVYGKQQPRKGREEREEGPAGAAPPETPAPVDPPRGSVPAGDPGPGGEAARRENAASPPEREGS